MIRIRSSTLAKRLCQNQDHEVNMLSTSLWHPKVAESSNLMNSTHVVPFRGKEVKITLSQSSYLKSAVTDLQHSGTL